VHSHAAILRTTCCICCIHSGQQQLQLLASVVPRAAGPITRHLTGRRQQAARSIPIFGRTSLIAYSLLSLRVLAQDRTSKTNASRWLSSEQQKRIASRMQLSEMRKELG
jgi:hypothetical protein